MSERFKDNAKACEALSALADGEAGSSDVARACAAWRDDVQARDAWHGYHLIGDAMRSEGLADDRGSNAFLMKFRTRLAQEPVVLAPQAAASAHSAHQGRSVLAAAVPARKHSAWAGPFAVAAGFVMVVGALVSGQVPPVGTGAGSGQMAHDATPSAGVQLAVAGASQQGGLDRGLGLVGEASLASSDDAHAPGVAGQGATFSSPERVAHAVMRNAQLDQLLESRRAALSADSSFSDRSKLIQQVVYSGP